MESRLSVAVLVAVLVAGGGVAAAKLKPCEQAIYYCCDPETNSALPLKCFEENKCAGLYWAGSTICSQAYIDKVTRKRKFVEVVGLHHLLPGLHRQGHQEEEVR